MTPHLIEKLKLARSKSNHHQHKIAAMVMFQGRILGVGCNDKFRTHPAVHKFHPHKTIHAEISAVFKVRNRELLKRCEIVVYRENRNGDMVCAKPCPTCTEMLKTLGVRTVVYSDIGGWKKERIA